MDPRSEQTRRLFEEARAGRREAYEELFALYRAELARDVQRKLRGRRARVEASDVVQEALSDALRGLPDFEPRGPGSFRRWLARIVDNRLKMMLKAVHAQKRAGPRETPLGSSVCASSGLSPSGAAALEERRARLERALESLSPDHREVLRLARIREHSIAEVAREMGRSENAVKKLLARALLELRKELPEDAATRE